MSDDDLVDIKSEPIDDDNFGSTGCIKIETVHGFEIKCEADNEEVIQEVSIPHEQPSQLAKKQSDSDKALEILEKLKNSKHLVVRKMQQPSQTTKIPGYIRKAQESFLISQHQQTVQPSKLKNIQQKLINQTKYKIVTKAIQEATVADKHPSIIGKKVCISLTGATKLESQQLFIKIKNEPPKKGKKPEIHIKQEELDVVTSIKSTNLFECDNDELFQYNVVNSFRSDLATRRNVSHTVVNSLQTMSKGEIAAMAREELKKLEIEFRQERERLSAASIPRTITKVTKVNLAMKTDELIARIYKKPGRPPGITAKEYTTHQCPVCLIKFKELGQLIGHKRLHDSAKAKLQPAEATKNLYAEVRMKIEKIGNRRSIHVLMPSYDYAFVVTNSTATKLYLKCFRQTCEVKAYSTTDGKYYVRRDEAHSHESDRDTIVAKINEAHMKVLQKSSEINRQVHEEMIERNEQNKLMDLRKTRLIERIKRSQEEAARQSMRAKRKRLS